MYGVKTPFSVNMTYDCSKFWKKSKSHRLYYQIWRFLVSKIAKYDFNGKSFIFFTKMAKIGREWKIHSMYTFNFLSNDLFGRQVDTLKGLVEILTKGLYWILIQLVVINLGFFDCSYNAFKPFKFLFSPQDMDSPQGSNAWALLAVKDTNNHQRDVAGMSPRNQTSVSSSPASGTSLKVRFSKKWKTLENLQEVIRGSGLRFE